MAGACADGRRGLTVRAGPARSSSLGVSRAHAMTARSWKARGAREPSAEAVIGLKGGLVVHLAVLRLLWSLEDRGLRLKSVGNRLRVQPVKNLTAEETAAIRRHRDQLLTLSSHEPSEVM